jgi:signal transduction histidine kinase
MLLVKTNREGGLHRDRHSLIAGFWGPLALAAVLAVVALVTMQAVVRSLRAVAFEDAEFLLRTHELRIAVEVKSRTARSFLLTGSDESLRGMREAEREIGGRLAALHRTLPSAEEARLLDRVEAANRAYDGAFERVIAQRLGGAPLERVVYAFELDVQPAREELAERLRELSAFEERRLHAGKERAEQTVRLSLRLLLALVGLAAVASAVLWVRLSRARRAERAQQDEAARHLARVEELNRELDAFAGRVSHDLRNLITPISVAVAIVRRSADQPERIGEMVDKIQRSIDRSLAMLGGLLAFSRSGAPDRSATSPVAAVVDDVLDQLALLAARVDATVERDVEPALVACSRELLGVVLLNLLGNALKFMDGRDRRRLRIAARAIDGACVIVIVDTGPGIPESAIGHIFEPFYRVPGTVAPGTGIGLATVARVVDAHGGSIAVESTPGAGATFRVQLPLAADHAPRVLASVRVARNA